VSGTGLHAGDEQPLVAGVDGPVGAWDNLPQPVGRGIDRAAAWLDARPWGLPAAHVLLFGALTLLVVLPRGRA